MEIIIYLILVILLVALNGFFTTAEFATVKIRPTQMEALIANGDKRAEAVKYIQKHIEEFLSVCQVGITLASVGLGFVGEPAFAEIVSSILEKFLGSDVSEVLVHSISITSGFIIISFLHIVFGELIPKSLAMRMTEKSALLIAYPLIVFRHIFILPIWLLNKSVNLFLQSIGFRTVATEEQHSEEEIRIILEQSQSNGVMSFRRLLFMENILDMEFLKVKNAMQVKKKVQCLKVGMSKKEVEEIVKKYRYSRYLLLDKDGEFPVGVIRIKDIYLEAGCDSEYNLEKYSKPYIRANEEEQLEQLLSVMQRKANHMAAVFNSSSEWTGMITLEDVIEEVVGTIEEEYPLEQPIYLSEYLTDKRVFLDMEGNSVIEGVKNSLKRVGEEKLPAPSEEIIKHIIEREKMGETYVGHGLCIPHARMSGVKNPMVIFSRFKTPIEQLSKKVDEKVSYLFILITPVEVPKIHQIFLSRIAGIFDSDFLESRLDDDLTPEEIFNLIYTAEQTAIA